MKKAGFHVEIYTANIGSLIYIWNLWSWIIYFFKLSFLFGPQNIPVSVIVCIEGIHSENSYLDWPHRGAKETSQHRCENVPAAAAANILHTLYHWLCLILANQCQLKTIYCPVDFTRQRNEGITLEYSNDCSQKNRLEYSNDCSHKNCLEPFGGTAHPIQMDWTYGPKMIMLGQSNWDIVYS